MTGVWLGACSTVAPGTSIGHKAVVAAGGLVHEISGCPDGAAGFNSVAHFSRSFSKRFGESPSAWRRQPA